MAEMIRGLIQRVLFEPKDGKYIFCRFLVEEGGQLREAKANLPTARFRPGDFLEVEGKWRTSTNKKTGKEEMIFRGSYATPALPSTQLGAVETLCACFGPDRHGVTKDRVEKVIATLGVGFMNDLATDATYVAALSENPQKYGHALVDTWKKRFSAFWVDKILHSAGLADPTREDILDAIGGAEAYSVIHDNPYMLSRISSVGFGNADRVGQYMGISPEDQRRILAAARDTVKRSFSNGGTFAPLTDIVSEVDDLTGLSTLALTSLLSELHKEDLVVFGEGEKVGLTTRELFELESAIANDLVGRLANPSLPSDEAVAAASSALFSSNGYSHFDDVQRSAVEMAATWPVSVITGGPGVGKTTVTKAAIALIESLHPDCRILPVAPTGKAAQRLSESLGREATTGHDALGAVEDKVNGETLFRRNENNPLPPKTVLVLDEGSMSDVHLTAGLLRALPADGRVLFIGDRHQLPSVGPGAVLRDILQAQQNGTYIVPRTELERVYRSAEDSRIPITAKTIRNGELPELDGTLRSGVVFLEASPETLDDRIYRLLTRTLPGQFDLDPVHDVAVLSPQRNGAGGIWSVNRRLSSALNPDGAALPIVRKRERVDNKGAPELRIGDRVMFTFNDKSRGIANSNLGTLLSHEVRDDEHYANIQLDGGDTVSVHSDQWDLLIPGYALTIHKSQGSQYKAVVLVVSSEHSEMLDRTLLYTGWTRAQDFLFVVGDRQALETAIARTKAYERETTLQQQVEHLGKGLLMSVHPGAARASRVHAPGISAKTTPEIPAISANTPAISVSSGSDAENLRKFEDRDKKNDENYRPSLF